MKYSKNIGRIRKIEGKKFCYAVSIEVSFKMVDIRISILKIIQVVSFFVYLYTVISSYMKYDTMTNVDRIRKRQELPAIGYAFCINFHQLLRPNHSIDEKWYTGTYDEKHLRAATYGIEELEINLTMNGRNVIFKDNPYPILGYKCWSFDPPFGSSLEDEIFLVRTEYRNIIMAINRDLNHIVRRFIQNPIHMIISLHHNAFFWEAVVIKQLSFPYKTNCKHYNIYQHYCFTQCSLGTYDDTSTIRKCLKKCIEGDCFKLEYRARLGSIGSKEGMRRCFGSDYLSIITYPFLPLSLFIQQIVGLVTMFFEISISDVADYTLRKLTQLIANVLNCFIKCRKRCFILPSIIRILLYFCCMTHIIYSTHIYLQYQTSTESFLGSPMTDYIPTFGICFDMENQLNATTKFDDIKNHNSNFKEIANISSSGVQLYDYKAYKYYMNRKQCFALHIAHNTRFNREMITVKFVKDIPYNLSIDFFVKYPMTNHIFRSNENIYYEFKSQIIDLINLPSPFESNCLDYKSLGTSSRNGCHNSCLLDWYRKNNNQLPFNVINFKYFDMKMGSNYPNYSICHEKCKNVDCHETKLELVKINLVTLAMLRGFTILNPTKIISSKLQPNQSLVDFVTFTTSILTLW